MRNLLLSVSFVAALPIIAQADEYTVDPAHTYAHFGISHLGFSTLRGRIHATDGSFTLDQDGKTGSVSVKLDPNSIDTGHQKRDDHLRSPDFLNVVEFPEMSFESTEVSLTEDGGSIEGNLNLMGQSKPVTLTVTDWQCGENPMSKKSMCGFDATATIKRSDFGIQYGLPAIGDEMELWFEIEGYKN